MEFPLWESLNFYQEFCFQKHKRIHSYAAFMPKRREGKSGDINSRIEKVFLLIKFLCLFMCTELLSLAKDSLFYTRQNYLN